MKLWFLLAALAVGCGDDIDERRKNNFVVEFHDSTGTSFYNYSDKTVTVAFDHGYTTFYVRPGDAVWTAAIPQEGVVVRLERQPHDYTTPKE